MEGVPFQFKKTKKELVCLRVRDRTSGWDLPIQNFTVYPLGTRDMLYG